MAEVIKSTTSRSALGLLARRIVWRLLPHRYIVWTDELLSVARDLLPAVVSGLPSHDLRLWFYRRLGSHIGPQSSIHRGCRFYHLPGLQIGSNTVINPDVVLDGRCGLRIGRNVSISERAMLYSLQHDLDDPDFVTTGAPVVIEDYVFIGPQAIILPGVTVREGAAVAAGSVVTHDVDPYTVVAGVPARPVRTRTRDLRYRLDYRRSGY